MAAAHDAAGPLHPERFGVSHPEKPWPLHKPWELSVSVDLELLLPDVSRPNVHQVEFSSKRGLMLHVTRMPEVKLEVAAGSVAPPWSAPCHS